MSDVTRILNLIGNGEAKAASDLLPLVYEELRQMARRKIANEKPGQTLQPTALVHEAWMRLEQSNGDSNWDNRSHFFAAAAEAMRRILIDQARRKNSKKRGGDYGRVPSHDEMLVAQPEGSSNDDLLALDEALGEFERADPGRANVVKLHYFAGLTLQETADALGISLATVKRHWVFARSWLYTRIQGNQD
jgi:RNA polymerase sigma factor (TIGR02999 family)